MNGRVQRTLLFALLLMAVMPLSPAEAGGGCHSDQEQSVQPVAGTEVRMEQMCFSPAVVRVDPGATVRFSNQDSVVHVALGTGWGTGETMAPGGTFAHRFPHSGIYAYSCNLHPGMNGAIMVGGGDAAVPEARAELTSSSTSSAGRDVRFPALGALAGALFGALGTRRWEQRRRHA